MYQSIMDIVRESGRRVREAHGFTVEDKGTRENIVTSADVENEMFLRRELLSLVPGSTFMGEEGETTGISPEGYTWIVDPIDGTTDFSRGIPIVAVSVALFKDGQPHAGYVYNPFTDSMYHAVKGQGAFKNGRPIRVSDRPLEQGVMCTAWCAYEKRLPPPCFKVSERMHPLCNDIRRTGSAAVELCMLAEGAAELYFEIRLSPWDHAAAMICLSEAGGVARAIEGDIVFDRPCPVIAANNGSNLDILYDIVSEEFDGRTPY